MTLSAAEQYFLELQNRARLDPAAEAARYGIDLNQGLAAGTLTAGSRQVLAPNALLNDAAAAHSSWMLATDTFAHSGTGGSTPGERMQDAGYAFTGNWTWGENIAWSGTTGTVNLETAIAGHHAGLFRSAGHRSNTLSDGFAEIGVGQVGGQFFSNNTNWNASMLTVNFAASGSSVFVTGVAYVDHDGDGFYSIGEGRGGLTMQIVGGAAVTNGAAGGYALATLAAATTSVLITHGAFQSGVVVDTRGGNVKLDLVGDNLVLTSGSIQLVSGAATNATLLGLDDLSATGNAENNRLIGNSGANTLAGGLGADTLTGGLGNDTLSGGAGADRLDGDLGRDLVSYADATIGLRADLQVATTNTGFAAGDVFTGVEDLFGSAHGDTLLGDAANNAIWGDAGSDAWLDGRIGNDTVYGGAGNDVLIGGWGADSLDGGDGARDRVQYTDSTVGLRVDIQVATYNTGVAAGDTYTGVEDIFGSSHGDLLLGDAGGNNIWGSGGNDVIDGRNGNDTLIGGAGNDTLTGGVGADVFLFETTLGATNRDTVNSYSVVDDTIQMENAIFTALTATGALASTAFVTGAAATTAAHRIIYNTSNGQLLYDADGNGAGAAVLFATLTPGLAMGAGEFLVV